MLKITTVSLILLITCSLTWAKDSKKESSKDFSSSEIQRLLGGEGGSGGGGCGCRIEPGLDASSSSNGAK